ncbi:MAG TPA: carbonic anhydrase [Egibacteraceae bacterium]|nr:carbonic anhydrase [Egibacteraceae bacterium]
MSDDLLQNLLAANRDYADGGHDAMAPVTPRLRLAIVTCMDARLMPPDALGLQPGDAHIIRNAGGRVTDDVLRSLAVSCAVLGVRRIVVIPHTQCGMYKSEEEIRAAIRDVSGHDGPARLHEYGDPEAALRRDVERVRSAPFLPPDVSVWGARFDVETGRITVEVDA